MAFHPRSSTRVVKLFERLVLLPPSQIPSVICGNDHGGPVLPQRTGQELTSVPPLNVLVGAAQLLVRCGDWQRALAVADALPVAQSADVRRWAVSAQGALSFDSSIPQCDNASGSVVASSYEVTAVEERGHGTKEPATGNASLSTSSSDWRANLSAELALCSTSELVQKGLSLQRVAEPPLARSPGLSVVSPSSLEVAVMQAVLFDTLQHRGKFRELTQCIVNWQRKGLLPTRPSIPATAQAATSVPVEKAAADLHAGPTTAPADYFDAIHAMKMTLFPLYDHGPAGMRSGTAWRDVLESTPAFFARCVRDAAVAERFIRQAGPAAGHQAVCTMMDAVWKLGQAPSFGLTSPPLFLPSVAGSRSLPCEKEEQLDALWRGISMLLRTLRHLLERQSKGVKEELLYGLLKALQATPTCNDKGVPSPSPPLTSKTLTAMRASVESVCTTILRNEAHARFIGMAPFAGVAQQLSLHRLRCTNALVQCLFLTMGDRTEAATVSDGPLHGFLASSPSQRWRAALALLQECHETGALRLTTAHLRALLSGLQSMSIVHTWTEALRCVESCMQRYSIQLDEATLLKVVLNLKQSSWERAFDVMRWYPSARQPPPSAAGPPAVLRDLHLIALKYASWEVTLSMLDDMMSRHSTKGVPFMNYLYGLHAAGVAGNCQRCLSLLRALPLALGAPPSSPYHEATVAIPALAMLNYGHAAELVMLMRDIRKTYGQQQLTRRGAIIAYAAELLALLSLQKDDALVRHLCELSDVSSLLAAADPTGAPLPSTTGDIPCLTHTLELAHVLQTMRGMEHLRAPIRLVMDVLMPGRTLTADDNAYTTLETRQRGTTARRPLLYLPPAHVERQTTELARAMGLFIRRAETVLPSVVVQAVSNRMAYVGGGVAFLTATLLQ